MIALSPVEELENASPVHVEFEDEKTSTLFELLNKISEEMPEANDSSSVDRQTRMAEVRKQYLAKQAEVCTQQEVIPKYVKKPPEKEAACSLTKTKGNPEVTCKSKPTPVKDTTAIVKNELLLSPSFLKVAPNRPLSEGKPIRACPVRPASKVRISRHVPFSVELGKAGRHPQYAGKTGEQQHYPCDLNVVELDDSQSLLAQFQDNVSDQDSLDIGDAVERPKEP